MANLTALTPFQINLIQTAVAKQPEGNAIAGAINNGTSASAALAGIAWQVGAVIKAAHVSTTTDFGALKVGDQVVHIPASAGNSIFYTVATAGTLPAAAIVGDLYIAFRAFSYSQPAVPTVVL